MSQPKLQAGFSGEMKMREPVTGPSQFRFHAGCWREAIPQSCLM
jgi:hypothetical protein